jgi:regulatory protein YycI of two-component signal transduction system YycFG
MKTALIISLGVSSILIIMHINLLQMISDRNEFIHLQYEVDSVIISGLEYKLKMCDIEKKILILKQK